MKKQKQIKKKSDETLFFYFLKNLNGNVRIDTKSSIKKTITEKTRLKIVIRGSIE